MKAIIIAAGKGNRLMPLTNDIPKCLLTVKGKAILQWQLEALNQCGVKDVVLVRGYKKEMLNFPGIKYHDNLDYENNNILKSLFYAETEMNEEFIFSYSDIVYEKAVLEKLLMSKGDISLVVDVDWLVHYEQRFLHPVEEAELVMVENNRITRIGKEVVPPDRAHGEFIGLAKFTEKGAEVLKSNYERITKQYHDKSFQHAPSPEKAYLTDMIQELIDRGFEISNVDIRGGWVEIDTNEDLAGAQEKWPR